LFEVENAKKISECGLLWTDAYGDLFAPGLIYAGRDPFSTNPKDYEDVYEKAMLIRPYIRTFSNSYYNNLADGEMCASPSWTGDTDYYTFYGAEKAGVKLVSFIPKEGTYLDYEGVGILSDAKNKEEAYLFMNYVLKPDEAAAFTNDIIYPNPVLSSWPLVNKKIMDMNLIFNPTAEEMKKIHVWPAVYDPKITRLQTRLWTKFKTKI
jgi:putrescine transport system substrate-binding protein